jgi:glycerol kinase
MRCILALDQSTSATKALLFAQDGRVLDRESLDHRQIYPQPGWAEHDGDEIWHNTLKTLSAVIARSSLAGNEIVGLSITNQRETIVIFERGSGQPLHPVIVWQCRRSEAICATHIAAGHNDWVRERTGLRIDPYFSGSKLQWVMQNRPQLAAQLAAGEALIGTIDTYLIYRLTEGAVFATDFTNASRTLLFDLRHLSWDEALCDLWQVPRAALPDVRESFASFGETTLDGTLKRPLEICGVMGDSQAALFAHGCFEPGSAKVTFGTGSSLLLNIGAELKLSGQGAVTTLAWVYRGEPTYAFEGIIVSSASTLTWLRDQLQLVDRVEHLEVLASAVPNNGGVYLVPAFSGLGFPHWAPAARAAVVGLSSHSDRRHVARAALESIAFQVADALESMRSEAEVSLKTLHCDGGAIGNRFLMQFTADITGATLVVSSVADCSALGVARAGLLGLGVLRSLAEFAAPAGADVLYVPQLDASAVNQLRAGWAHAVRQTTLSIS